MVEQIIKISIDEADRKTEDEVLILEPDLETGVIDITVGKRTFAIDSDDLKQAVILMGLVDPSGASKGEENSE
jgi:hypothetical protein